MRFFVTTLDGSRREIQANGTTTLDEIRENVVEMMGMNDVSIGQIRLVLNNSELGHAVLAGSGITDGDTVMIVIKERQRINVQVLYGTETISLSVENCELVVDVKNMIQQRRGFLVDEQILTFQGREIRGGRISHPGVVNGSRLQLTLREFEIFVKDLQGKTHTLWVRSTDTVETLMEKVKMKTGVLLSQQILTYAGKQLAQGHILSFYNITRHATLHLNGRLRGGV